MPNPHDSIDRLKAIQKDLDNATFDEWNESGATKLFFRLLPPCETESQKEILRALIRSAFDAGSATGSAGMLVSLMDRVRDKAMSGET